MLLEFDLSSADWVVTAYYAPEPSMIAVVKDGRSPHLITGSKISGVSEDTVNKEHKLIGLNNDPEAIKEIRKQLPELSKAGFLPRTMSIRQAAKKANHSLNYRLGYKTFALRNEMEEREAKRIVELYRGVAYPKLQDWYDKIDKTIRDTRTLVNFFGRRVYFQGALDDETFREATSFIPQSSVFDITGAAIPRLFEDESPEFQPSELLAQVHDSLLVQHRSRDFAAMARFAIKLAFDYMSPTLSYNGMDFTLGVGLKAGLNWAGMTELPLTRDADVLASDLERVWHGARGRLG